MFWATPGGGVEVGETDLAAAQRETSEELHLNVPLVGPVYTSISEFEHAGEIVTNTDVFFIGRCKEDMPRLDPTEPEERAAMTRFSWLTPEEIETSAEAVFPEGLAAIIRGLVAAYD